MRCPVSVATFLRRPALVCAALLVLASMSLHVPRVSAAEADSVNVDASLQQILSADPRKTTAACGNVDYGDLRAAGRTNATTPNPGGPVVVEIFLFILAVDQIEPATNSFRFEGYGGLVWCDSRLAFDAETEGAEFRMFPGEQAWDRLKGMWFPGVILPSQLGLPERTNEMLVIHSDGTVRFSLKFNTRMIADYDFTLFPGDRQILRIPIQPSLWNAGLLELREASGQVGFDRGFRIPEWNVVGHTSRIDRDAGFPQFVMQIEIGRQVGFYLWKILLPLIIITGVAWSTFWMTRDGLAQRQRQSATAVLSLVAYQFVAGATLPRVSYLTLMDGIFLWSYLCVGGTLYTSILNKRRFRHDEQLGLRADRAGRLVFPFVYLGGILLILAGYRLMS